MSGLAVKALNQYSPGLRIFSPKFTDTNQVETPKQPENPFPGINPGNPTSWYGAYVRLISGGEEWAQGIENQIFDSVLDPNGIEDPNMLRDLLFRAGALVGLTRTNEPTAIDKEEENKKAEKDSSNLALAA